LKQLEAWGKRHVSDHSGWHHRQVLLLLLSEASGFTFPYFSSSLVRKHKTTMEGRTTMMNPENKYLTLDDIVMLWIEEFKLNNTMIEFYPGHESLWYHRRFLIYHWNHFPQLHPDIEKQITLLKTKDPLLSLPSVDKELEFAQTCSEDSTVTRFEEQKRFATEFQRWISTYCQPKWKI
jgi:protein prenyltransferase alpha subunit repeat containing protein 1